MAAKNPCVADWMTSDPVTVALDASALEALDSMTDHGIRHLPVTEADQRVVGIVSLDDLRAALPVQVNLRAPLSAEERAEVRDYAVRDLMTFEPVCARADTPLAEAAARMAQLRIGCLPVVDAKGRIEGILSETDALVALAELLRHPDKPVLARERARTELLVDRLRAERDRLCARLSLQEERWQRLNEERAEVPTDRAELARGLSDMQLEGALADWAEHRLRSLDHALGLAAEGRLGICDRCGGSIPVVRLRALPGTTTCLRCAREHGPDAGRR